MSELLRRTIGEDLRVETVLAGEVILVVEDETSVRHVADSLGHLGYTVLQVAIGNQAL